MSSDSPLFLEDLERIWNILDRELRLGRKSYVLRRGETAERWLYKYEPTTSDELIYAQIWCEMFDNLRKRAGG